MPCRSSLRFHAFGLGIVVVLSTSPAPATTTTPQNLPEHVTRNHQDVPLQQSFINHKDCVDDTRFTFLLNADPATSSNNLEVWAASGSAVCEDPTVQDDGQCRQVFKGSVDFPVQVEIPVWNMVRAGFGPLPATPLDATVCESGSERQDLTLKFLFVDTGGNVLPGFTVYPFAYDMVGPPAPTGVSAGVAERALIVGWNDPSNPGDGFGGYKVYVDELGPVDPDGGTTDGGTTDGGSTSTGCFSDELIPGMIPTIGSTASAGIAATNVEAGGLKNGYRYAVAVSSIDDFINPGPLSGIACGVPEPVTGFFEAYRAAGGGAGGGYCALGAGRSRSMAAVVALAALALVGRRLRRARANARGDA